MAGEHLDRPFKPRFFVDRKILFSRKKCRKRGLYGAKKSENRKVSE
jgi:hypothetical protein